MEPTNSDQPEQEDFIEMYLRYTAATECPKFFHRWCAVTSLSAYLGRRTFFNHGHFVVHPNLYTMLVGSPGTKKSSAIKISAKLLKLAGYTTFAAKKTRQEKFLLDLAEQSEQADLGLGVDILDQNLWGDDVNNTSTYDNKPPAECFVAADEFNNFIGLHNMDFVSILGELWDYEGVYDHKLKNSKSVYIPNPTISILGGNTPTGLSQAFPADTIGQGFFSRLLLVFAEPTGHRYTFPPAPDLALQTKLIAKLHEIKEKVHGEVTMTPEAIELLDVIYTTNEGIEDIRFEHYANRRLMHLLKLCLVVSAARVSTTIAVRDVTKANTLLILTEQLMPKALGEFGRAKNSGASHKVMAVIDAARMPVPLLAIWKAVHQDFETRNQLIEILGNLTIADKVQVVEGGYLPVKQVISESVRGTVDWNTISPEERNLV